MGDAGAQLHERHHRQAEGGALLPPRRGAELDQQRAHLEPAAAPILPVDLAPLPLQRLVLPAHRHAAGGGQPHRMRSPEITRDHPRSPEITRHAAGGDARLPALCRPRGRLRRHPLTARLASLRRPRRRKHAAACARRRALRRSADQRRGGRRPAGEAARSSRSRGRVVVGVAGGVAVVGVGVE